MWGEYGFVTMHKENSRRRFHTPENGAIGVYGRHPVYMVLGWSWAEWFCGGIEQLFDRSVYDLDLK
jgi:hypothetical protein